VQLISGVRPGGGQAGEAGLAQRPGRQLGAGQRWDGDLRKMRDEASGDRGALRRLLKQVPGIGDTGADIFCREVQQVWPSLRPYIDRKALDGAARLGLPKNADELAALAWPDDLARLVAGLVRVSIDKKLVDEVRRAAA
jgi:hypothetical protein